MLSTYKVKRYLDGTFQVMDGVRVCVSGLVSEGQADNVVKELEWAQVNVLREFKVALYGQRSTD